MNKMIKIAALLMMVGACLTYPTDEVKPPTVNAVPDNVQTNPVPNQSKPEQSPVPVPAPIPEQENPLAKPEKDLTTDNSFWWGKSYYPIRRSYYYYPRSYSYYKSYPYYSYWNPYSYWW